jgi:hypothetical protein
LNPVWFFAGLFFCHTCLLIRHSALGRVGKLASLHQCITGCHQGAFVTHGITDKAHFPDLQVY